MADEDAERSKHFDEEVGSGNRSQGTAAGTSKTGDNGKLDLPPATITEREVIDNKNIGKDTQWKKSWLRICFP